VRFADAFEYAKRGETLAGKIVLTIGCNMKTDPEFKHMTEPEKIEAALTHNRDIKTHIGIITHTPLSI